MADVAIEKPKRKSVAFANADEVVDSDGNIEETPNGGDKETAESHNTESADPAVDEVTDMFASLAKKKKPKKKKEEDEEEGGATEPAGDGELDLSALKKKKKTKKSKTEDLEKVLAGGEDGEEKVDDAVPEGDPIAGTGVWKHDASQDIPYTLLLGRFFTLLHDRHPDIAGGNAKSFRIPPPQCLREGNKKTLLANLPEICKRLKRNDEHVMQFLFAELGTSGSVDASRRLIIRGKFQSKQIEMILRRYIMDYVICKTCKSPDTLLERGENRLNFLTCQSCGSRRSVTAIKSGFSAQIGKRKKQVG